MFLSSKRAVQLATTIQALPATPTEELILKVYPEQLLDTRPNSQGELEVLTK